MRDRSEEVVAFLLAGSVGDSLDRGQGSGEHLQILADKSGLTFRYFT